MKGPVTIAFLHLAPITGEIGHNRALIELGVQLAAASGAHWVITPEFGVCGYGFAEHIGTEWILSQPDTWMKEFCDRVAKLKVTVFLSHPERDEDTKNLYNSLFAIGPGGILAGRHRKINVLPGSESWATRGDDAAPVPIDGTSVGMLICADVCTPGVYNRLKSRGAEILVSAASWGPGPYEPSGEWEQCTRETGLSLLVCNRTGRDTMLDFTDAESVVVQHGRRAISFRSGQSSIFFAEWDREHESRIRRIDQCIPF